MIKAIAIFFGLFFCLVALLFWVKTAPANADVIGITVSQIPKTLPLPDTPTQGCLTRAHNQS
ncbi:hypothetical protein [uncultured Litoreibacter sp.]|uniref:hypothetical protein n=1 Tax=uncultured Litoreibacter sp. TaxID=1392394 RepID=UPI00262D1303|nr:hypothetical protein [uncultured Litoreibacter sp.]